MGDLDLFLALLASTVCAFFLGKSKARAWQISDTKIQLNSLPNYYGYLVALWTIAPSLIIFLFWSLFETNIIFMLIVAQFSDLQSLSNLDLNLLLNKICLVEAIKFNELSGADLQVALLFLKYTGNSFKLKAFLLLVVAILSGTSSYWYITPITRVRNKVERFVVFVLFLCAIIAIITTVGIVLSVLFESINFFSQVPILDFIFGTHWSPQAGIYKTQAAYSGTFGAVPIFWGTLFISLIAILIAGPIGLLSAIYLAEYASPKIRSIIKPTLEILAGVPTVVYGFFAALTVGPIIRDFGQWLKEIGINLELELLANMTVSAESTLAAGLVMGMMIVPFILSLSDDVISAVPSAMRDGSIALGATKSETIFRVIVPAALPGIIGSFLLAISRAIGETMIVLMAAGIAANLSVNPLDTVTTVTTQIVVLLTGDQEFDNVKTLAAFALGLGLFIITLLLNITALYVVRKYREQYE